MDVTKAGALLFAVITYLFMIYPFIAGYFAFKENFKKKGMACLLTFLISLFFSFAGILITMRVISFQNSYLFQNEAYALFWEISILLMSGAASLVVYKKNKYEGVLCFPVLYIVIYFASMLIMRGVRYYAGG
jgi:ABC-type xylose transport system permease subunit